MVNLETNNVTDLGNSFLIAIKSTKNKIDRNFVIKNSENNVINFVETVRKYIALRKAGTPHSKFFVQYINKECTKRPVGKNMFGKFPQQIATFLKLENAASYTGHCFRRTSASILADSGATIDVLKRHGGWRSSSVAEGYVESSIKNKENISEKILGHASSASSTVPSSSSPAVQTPNHNLSIDKSNLNLLTQERLLNITNCNNVNVNININYNS